MRDISVAVSGILKTIPLIFRLPRVTSIQISERKITILILASYNDMETKLLTIDNSPKILYMSDDCPHQNLLCFNILLLFQPPAASNKSLRRSSAAEFMEKLPQFLNTHL